MSQVNEFSRGAEMQFRKSNLNAREVKIDLHSS
jgi:hypothetical protein